MTPDPVVETTGLSHRYGRTWALRECTLRLPRQQVIGLVGPNGAGKTTLLHILVGLLRPAAGVVRVLGRPPGAPSSRCRVGFVAQNKPLYPGFTVADSLAMGGWLNPSFDATAARRRLEELDIPLRRRIGRLSGGQQAQVALALALGKQPDLVILDEPVSSLDPLARHTFLSTMMTDVAETGRSVLFSSHVLGDLERVCDHLVLMSASRVQLCDDVGRLQSSHLVLSGPRTHTDAIAAAHTVVRADYAERQASLLIRAAGPFNDPAFSVRPASLEEIVLAYMSTPDVTALAPLRLANRTVPATEVGS